MKYLRKPISILVCCGLIFPAVPLRAGQYLAPPGARLVEDDMSADLQDDDLAYYQSEWIRLRYPGKRYEFIGNLTEDELWFITRHVDEIGRNVTEKIFLHYCLYNRFFQISLRQPSADGPQGGADNVLFVGEGHARRLSTHHWDQMFEVMFEPEAGKDAGSFLEMFDLKEVNVGGKVKVEFVGSDNSRRLWDGWLFNEQIQAEVVLRYADRLAKEPQYPDDLLVQTFMWMYSNSVVHAREKELLEVVTGKSFDAMNEISWGRVNNLMAEDTSAEANEKRMAFLRRMRKLLGQVAHLVYKEMPARPVNLEMFDSGGVDSAL